MPRGQIPVRLVTRLRSITLSRWLTFLLICGNGLYAIPSTSQVTPEDARAAAMGLHETQGRLQIPALTHPLKLEEENEVPIQLHGFKVRSAVASWRYDRGNGNLGPTSDEKDVAILYYADGSAHIKVTPEKLGKCLLLLYVLFEDGGIDDESINLKVIYPDRKPEGFIVARMVTGYEQNTGTINMDFSPVFGKIAIEPIALYKDALSPAHIPTADVKFKVIAATESNPPISIDKSGMITALHTGHALIQTTFQDFSVLTCVNVLENVNLRGRSIACSDLVPAGMPAPLR